jgi:hypothetical protein
MHCRLPCTITIEEMETHMTLISIESKAAIALVALVASIGMAHAQGSGGGTGAAGGSNGGGTGAAGSGTSTPSGTNIAQPNASTGSMSTGKSGTTDRTTNGMSKKGNPAAQDCREHANSATVQKRNGAPGNADSGNACGDMNNSNMKGNKSTSGATTGQPMPASK